ncbi:uncharacterized protein FFUJ_06616 [Fusarium fujikuroi IMI 58289]|uniref:Uncharacterized protein n=1 Tax=Gibberella fujikuroi (strain CBS 195.34 / IMI 58289 / NRRL A-6831) TaxID=1279085 RepID=S0EDZ7_GIBF5|nr:uncharacterized protein FFUJ_06616 [Fusarium fujikuroi IMI 58289]KLP23262.1 uncharacterized protein LW94_13904 [Fusarium fujikuroi]CCT70628.1 uncharacterized protein FFUJ_06616 [Fusarium fujikuroi IMI 58289]SCN83228.1 uncharacterized protein FFM5_02975 [Fusarium fujikuroi]SCV36360.1 uncharacterized protein FFB14_06056 [Fusarium fujikuroi]
MAFSSVHAALEPYVDIPFNASLSGILFLAYRCLISKPGLLLIIVYTTSAIIVLFDRTSTRKEMAKTMAELPLGLGSVLWFIVSGRSTKVQWLHAFTIYVNFAVYGNILMMVATPSGGTFRGIGCKVACISLSAWIVLQGYQVQWETIMLHDDLFVFTAASKSWIFAHAAYRFILLTLPCFGSGRRHRLMEVYSLGLTYLLSWSTGLPFEYCFGMADTIVAPAVTAWSSISKTFNLITRDAGNGQPSANGISDTGDVYLGIVALAVAAYAGLNMLSLGRLVF